MKTNIATTPEQSQRLLACGVPADTADMFYQVPITASQKAGGEDVLLVKKADKTLFDTDTPAWSLSRLLELMPKIIESHSILPETYSLLIMPKDNACWACYANRRLQYIVRVAQPIIEACVQLIEWLTANGYKLNEQ